jgi:hypothetical protein
LRRVSTSLHNSDDKSSLPFPFPVLSLPLFEFGAEDVGRGTFFGDKPDTKPNNDNNDGANISPKPAKTILNGGGPLNRDGGLSITSVEITETYAGAGIPIAGPRKQRDSVANEYYPFNTESEY